jgi:hypothetical protein
LWQQSDESKGNFVHQANQKEKRNNHGRQLATPGNENRRCSQYKKNPISFGDDHVFSVTWLTFSEEANPASSSTGRFS